MEVTIDTYVYDDLAEYCNEFNESVSVVATKAIKKYLNSME